MAISATSQAYINKTKTWRALRGRRAARRQQRNQQRQLAMQRQTASAAWHGIWRRGVASAAAQRSNGSRRAQRSWRHLTSGGIVALGVTKNSISAAARCERICSAAQHSIRAGGAALYNI